MLLMSPQAASAREWEASWAPYDEPTYQEALSYAQPGAIVLDIGAGDLRFTRMLATRAHFVYAIERRPELLTAAYQPDFPRNIEVICADARTTPFPDDIDTAVLLMRHCQEFGRYLTKLQSVGCRSLITNARWGMGVELIDLTQSAVPYELLPTGWYACRCGSTGFLECPPEALHDSDLGVIAEAATCPACLGRELR